MLEKPKNRALALTPDFTAAHGARLIKFGVFSRITGINPGHGDCLGEGPGSC